MKLTVSNVLIFFSIASASAQSVSQCFPSNLPWVNFEGNDYIFSRMHYNSECVDDTNRQYDWGAIQGVNTGTEDVCGSMCVKGHGSFEARGCSTSQRPDPKKLVGFNYDCDEATCYCLYERYTLSNKYNRCFDEMNTSNDGQGDVFQTTTKPGTTCYSLHIQPSDPPPSPEPRGKSICTRALDYECYKHGRPKCCTENDGKDCPSEMTICDNFPENWTGTLSYCSGAPNFACWRDGRPSCCRENALNCPRDEQPACDVEPLDCDDFDINSWDTCQSYCGSLSNNWSASYEGRSSNNLTKCECDFGKNRENNFTCERKANNESNQVLASQRYLRKAN